MPSSRGAKFVGARCQVCRVLKLLGAKFVGAEFAEGRVCAKFVRCQSDLFSSTFTSVVYM